jgi:fructose-1-phosphate kinase PfkB-like protein
MQRTILRNLDQAHLGMMTTATLWSEVLLDQGGATYTEFQKALTELEIKSQVVVVRGEDRIKARITDAGRARLLEA